MTPRDPDRNASTSQATAIASFFAVSLALFGLAALLVGHAIDLWWYVGTTVSAGFCLALGTFAPVGLLRRLDAVILGIGALLFGATLAVGTGLADVVGLGPAPSGRIELWFGNPNILAAGLALFTLVFVQRRGRSWVLAGVLGGLGAVLLTGSRGAISALIAALLVSLWLRLASLSRASARKVVLIPLLIVVLSMVLIAVAFPPNRNLLPQSADFNAARWTHSVPVVSVEPIAARGPTGSGRGIWRIEARGAPDSEHQEVLLLQTVGRSIPGHPYLASVYLRSATPATVVLSTNLSERACSVADSWTRCVTPVGTGDGRHWAQFRLRARQPSDQLAIEVWGAMLEQGTRPSAYTATTRLSRTLGRLNALTWRRSYGWNSRIRLARDAWHLFLTRPLAGSGLHTIEHRLQSIEDTYVSANHAQNLVLNLLVESGVLGLVAWLIPLVGVLVLYRRAWHRWLPLVVLMLVLNIVDATFFTVGFYYLFWFELGTSVRPERRG